MWKPYEYKGTRDALLAKIPGDATVGPGRQFPTAGKCPITRCVPLAGL
jgi:hypothetical protein